MSEVREKQSRGYTPDRFDVPQKHPRVGAHRIAGRARTGWRWFLAAVILIAILVTLGIFWVNSQGAETLPRDTGPAQNAPSEEVEPELDPTATIAVLNGTRTPSLASGLDEVITSNGWGQIMFAGLAGSDDVQISAIFYQDEADKAAAEGLAELLGGMSTYASSDYESLGVRLIVLLGADYGGPGFSEAARIVADGQGDDVAPLDEQWQPPAPPVYQPPPPQATEPPPEDATGDTDLPPIGDDAGDGGDGGDGTGDGTPEPGAGGSDHGMGG